MNKFHPLHVFTGIVLCLALSSCSSTNRAYFDTLKLAVKSNERKSLTIEQVRQSKADLLQVTVGERPPVVMALAFIEKGQNKWVSADHAIFTIEQGVIVQTEGMSNDVLYTSNLAANPLADKGMIDFSWQRQLDIAEVGYGLTVTGNWQVKSSETIEVLGYSFNTRRIEETLQFPKTTPFIETTNAWTNTYWVDQNSGELLKASVRLMPEGARIDMTYLSRAARHTSAAGSTL